jgi:hypothetical protein
VTVYVLLFISNAAIIGCKVSSEEPEVGAGVSYLLYECVLDSAMELVLIGRAG